MVLGSPSKRKMKKKTIGYPDSHLSVGGPRRAPRVSQAPVPAPSPPIEPEAMEVRKAGGLVLRGCGLQNEVRFEGR